MPKDKKKQESAIEIHTNFDLPSIWVDNLGLGVRDDDVCILRFSTQLPEGHFEQTRVLTKRKNLEVMVDNLCEALDYYPKKKVSRRKK